MDGFSEFPPETAARYRRAGYWRGETLGNLLWEWARRDGERTALVTGDRRWSYGALDDRAERLAAGLVDLGIKGGDRVVVQLPNTAAFVTTTVALFRLGARPVFALPAHRRSEITHLAAHAEAVAYVIPDVWQRFDHRSLAAQVAGDVPSLEHVLVDGEPGPFLPLREIGSAPRPLPGPQPGDVAFFLLSGGTTGLPKLIPRTHDDYAYQLRATAEALGVGPDTVYLASLPVAHNAALGCPGLLGTLRAGGRVVLPDSVGPDVTFPLVASEGVTLTTLMPPLVQLWLDAAPFLPVDLSRVLLQVGGAKLAPDVARRVGPELGCRLTHWFGMAEGLLSFTRLDDPDDTVVNTLGRPLSPADEIRIVDPNGDDVVPGRVGELLTRGPYTLRGYFKAPDHNAGAFLADGFFRTGDLARVTPEGNIVIEGRIKDLINRGGEKVSAGELEDHLASHPQVRQVAVVAVPDSVMGEKTCAVVVARGRPPVLAELKAFLTQRGLADYKLPDRLELVASLPATKVGKIDKGTLRRAVAARAS
jgi:2,3-dihydroxybenzoate-AMP ligase